MDLKRKPNIRFKEYIDNWEPCYLGDIAQIRRGLTYKPNDIRNSGIRVLRSSNINDGYFQIFEDDVFVDKSAVNIPFVKNGDIIITSANGSSRLVGKHAIIKNIPDNSMIHGGFMLLAFTNEPYFLNSSMSSSWYRKFINIYVSGGNGAIGNLNKSDLDKQEILVPSVSEQQKIGNYFKNLDDLISLHQLKLEQLKKIKTFMLTKMLPKNGENTPKIRFNGYTYAWELYHIKDIGEYFNTCTLGYADLSDNGKNKCVIYGELYTKYNEKIENVVSRTNKDATPTKINDILFPTSTTVDALSLISPSCVNEENVVVGGDLFGIRPYENIDGNFISYCVNGVHTIKESLAKKAQGLTIVHLHYDAIKNEKLLIPLKEEQKNIADYFSKLDNLISLHQRKSILLKNIKEFLLKKMFINN